MTNGPIPVRDLAKHIQASGHKCTLLGVGPVSEIVVKATFEACARHKCPAIFIASRNQVDLKELGHGYLMGGMDQFAFTALLKQVQQQVGYVGPVYICRDHGGPWQRNVELDNKYPVAQAMEIAKQSFKADIEAGFNYLHIDPTKCPLQHTPSDIREWTLELQSFCEETRLALGMPEIDYEVGTEDIQGGLTSRDTFENFLKLLVKGCEERNLPKPTCIVGQTGTLTRMDKNIGHFDQVQTRELAAIAAQYGVGFKEHNGDYLSAASCRIHPDLGVTGLNVAPEFGLVETDACLALSDLEQKLAREGWVKEEETSHFRELLTEAAFTSSPWEKWMSSEVKKQPREKTESDAALRLLIARVCGHYVYDMPHIIEARATLFRNINTFGLQDGAHQYVMAKVRDAIEFYCSHLKLTGVNEMASCSHETACC